jgi:hypothetical protein
LSVSGTGDALVSLAMVVGAYIKDGMVFTIVPTDDFFVRLGKGEEGLA